MLRIAWTYLITTTVVLGCGSPGTAPAPPEPEADELAAIQEVVDLTYRVSSFDDAASADPEAFRQPFTAGARLAYVRDDTLVERTVDDYVELRRRMLDAGEIESLDEWEVAGRTEVFGDIAHRISSYRVRVDGSEELAEHGVMSFQLTKVGGAWKVYSLIWQATSPEVQLPARFGPTDEE